MKKFRIEVDGEEFIVNVEEIGSEDLSSTADVATEVKNSANESVGIKEKTTSADAEISESDSPPNVGEGDALAPMPGSILEINVKKGEEVEKGDKLLILEAMKMENEITAAQAGTVKEIIVKAGESVDIEDVLIVIE